MKINLVRTRCMVHMCFFLAMCAAHRAAAEDMSWTLESGLFLDAHIQKAHVDLGFAQELEVQGLASDIGWRGEIGVFTTEFGVRYPFTLHTFSNPILEVHGAMERTFVSDDGYLSITSRMAVNASIPVRRFEAQQTRVRMSVESEWRPEEGIVIEQELEAMVTEGRREGGYNLDITVDIGEATLALPSTSIRVRQDEEEEEVAAEIAARVSLSF